MCALKMGEWSFFSADFGDGVGEYVLGSPAAQAGLCFVGVEGR